MTWDIVFLPEADRDLDELSHVQRAMVRKAIERVAQNPLSQQEGGYRKPLGNRRGQNLTSLLKIKLRDAGIRIVYKVVKTDSRMLIIVIGAREDEEVYRSAYARRVKYGL